MDEHRRRFLTGLSARLDRDRALRENQVATPPKWLRRTEQSDAAHEPSPMEIPAAMDAAGGAEPPDRPTPAEVVATPRRPELRGPTVEALGDREPDQAPAAAIPWSETGMPQALRDAIASVRRVSHHQMYELPPPHSDQARYEQPPFDDDLADDQPSFDDAGAEEQPLFGTRALHEEPPFDDHATDAQLPFDSHATDAQPFGDRALHEEPPFDDHAADAQPPFGDYAADEQPPFGDDATDEQPAPGLWEDPQDRPPLRGGATHRRGLNFAAFGVATAFVLLAGVGLGVLSGGQDLDRLMAAFGWLPLAHKSVTTAPSAPASTGAVARPAEPEAPPQPSELATIRVAPLPATPVTERSPDPAPNRMPLPPPPKPAPRSSVAGEGTRTARLDSAVADAAAALLEADDAGGPFDPIFVKTPGSAPRVFIHYAESVAGAPATAMHLVRHLKAAGFTAEGRPVEFPVPTYSIRYFFEADRDEAEALSTSLEGQIPGGTALPVLDFTAYDPKPQQGHLEVWLRS